MKLRQIIPRQVLNLDQLHYIASRNKQHSRPSRFAANRRRCSATLSLIPNSLSRRHRYQSFRLTVHNWSNSRWNPGAIVPSFWLGFSQQRRRLLPELPQKPSAAVNVEQSEYNTTTTREFTVYCIGEHRYFVTEHHSLSFCPPPQNNIINRPFVQHQEEQ